MCLRHQLLRPLTVLLLLLALLTTAAQPAPDGACAVTLAPGRDLAAAAREAAPGATICLQAGTFRPFSLDERTAARLTLRGAGPDRTRIAARDADGVTLSRVSGLTLSGLSIEGGSPAGIYAAGATDLRLVNVQVHAA